MDIGKVYILIVSEYDGDFFVDSWGNSGLMDKEKVVVNKLEPRH